MRKKILLGWVAAACVTGASAAFAAGLIGNLPLIGGAGYCASTSTGPNGPICQSAVPAGPQTFAGTEYTNFDIGPLGGTNGGQAPQTAAVNLTQLGQGGAIDLTTVAAAQTIPQGTAFYYLDGAQAAAFNVTLPAGAIEGTQVIVVCETATAGALNILPNAGQNVKFNPNTACVAGTTYRYRYIAANSTWYKS